MCEREREREREQSTDTRARQLVGSLGIVELATVKVDPVRDRMARRMALQLVAALRQVVVAVFRVRVFVQHLSHSVGPHQLLPKPRLQHTTYHKDQQVHDKDVGQKYQAGMAVPKNQLALQEGPRTHTPVRPRNGALPIPTPSPRAFAPERR